jgi:ParB-like chromosome segregation protein Spo0J
VGERVIRPVATNLIDIDRWPLEPRTLGLVAHFQAGGTVPPIRLVRQPSTPGRFRILDGRHRLLATKLVGRRTITARYWR